MLNIIGKIIKFVLLPLVIAGAFFTWSLPRITTDYNFNTDELIYLSRTPYWTAFKSGDLQNPIWANDWVVYDQPQLTNYVYAAVPGDRALIELHNSPCVTHSAIDFYSSWQCLDGPPIMTWPQSITPLKDMVVKARTLATGISALAVATTYYLGLVVAGPVAGILASAYLGWFSYFHNLSTMIMMDQILLVFLGLQMIITLLLTRSQKPNLFLTLLLGLVTGLAFSTKISAAIPSLTIYCYLAYLSLRHKQINFLHLCISVIVGASIFTALHPFLWTNPVGGFLKMISWRTTQIANQSSLIYTPTGFIDKVTYASTELFSYWKSQNQAGGIMITGALAAISLLALFFYNQSFAILALTNIIVFVLILPIKWNRYLLPILPSISVIIGSLPTFLLSYAKTKLGKFTHHSTQLRQAVLGILFVLILTFIILNLPTANWLTIIISVLTIILSIQGFLMTRAMLYGFSTRDNEVLPTHNPKESFTLILPARDEAEVIGHTISSLSRLNYPKDLFEVLVMIRADDYQTIRAAEKAIANLCPANIRIIQIDGDAHNKAYSLNIGARLAKHNIIGIFDAEDDPHLDILSKVNNFMLNNQRIRAVQAPVHLTNINSSWYAGLNAIEYYYWFASVLPFLATKKIVPLGGNTIFIKKDVYQQIGFYDESCLTEDADFGIRLAANAIEVGIIQDPKLATKEGAPISEADVIGQRSRWDQGYFQVIIKGDWKQLSTTQKLYALYTLTQPLFRHLSFLNMIFAPLLASMGDIPLIIALFSFLPGYFLILQLGLYLLGLSNLAKLHNLKVSIWRYLLTIIAFAPYQALLVLATIRALFRFSVKNFSWEKTVHTNTHRPSLAILEG